MVQKNSVPSVVYGALGSFARSASGNPQGSHPPGLGGRSLRVPTRQDRVPAAVLKEPVKMYNARTIRVIYDD
jgi:hypothetical protein